MRFCITSKQGNNMSTLYKQAQDALVSGNYAECKRLMLEDNFDYVVVNGHPEFMLMQWDSVNYSHVFTVNSNDAEARKLFLV
jgi:hypothetical protein